MTLKDYKLIILDRDGVINIDDQGYINDPDKWHPFPGSLEAIVKLNHAGKKVAIASNQSGIGRGLITEPQLANVHHKMTSMLKTLGGHIDAITYCPHHPNDQCDCRKPKTLLFENLQSQFQVDKEAILIIGDSECDIESGKNFGCDAFLVKTGHGRKTLKARPDYANIPTHENLNAAVDAILQTGKPL